MDKAGIVRPAGDMSAMTNKLKQFMRDGEGLTVEFKRCGSEPGNSVYETVSAFSNRYGGHILLGVEDDGRISGVNPKSVANIKKGFASSLNNPERFAPTLFIAIEEAEIDGKTVLWCYVPPSSQVVMFGGRIYDRAEDGDMDITRNSEMVTHIHRRKSADYSERKIFPYAKDDDFDFARLMPKIRRLATNRLRDHPWANMPDMEILQSAGLYEEDRETGKTGYNLAAILLFGHDHVIRSCTANYITDAICRRENLDRYDDRLMVTTNLIDAYEQLIEFIAKHTLDRFFLIGGQSVSVRSQIAREIVSNILVHREYTSAYPAKIIIERERIVTENWNLPKTPGRIDPKNFTPYPKNPLLAAFFTNIGRADILGSGVRNLYKFTKIYSGNDPQLIEGDVFRTIVPLASLDDAIITKGGITIDLTENVKSREEIDESREENVKSREEIDESREENVKSREEISEGREENVKSREEIDEGREENVKSREEIGEGREETVESREKNVERIFELICADPAITQKELAQLTGLSRQGIEKNIGILKTKGLIQRVGHNKGGYWKVVIP